MELEKIKCSIPEKPRRRGLESGHNSETSRGRLRQTIFSNDFLILFTPLSASKQSPKSILVGIDRLGTRLGRHEVLA